MEGAGIAAGGAPHLQRVPALLPAACTGACFILECAADLLAAGAPEGAQVLGQGTCAGE